MIKGALFDIDGTILDSMSFWNELPQRYLSSLHIDAPDDLGEIMKDLSVDKGIEFLQYTYIPDYSLQEIASSLNKLTHTFYEQEVTAKKGIHTFLDRLKAQHIPMILVTSGERRNAEAALSRLGLLEYFNEMIVCDEEKLSKSSPEIYIKAAKHLHTQAEETIVFEDLLSTIKCAKQAGFMTCGIKDNYSLKDYEEIKEIADYTIEDFDNQNIL